jgi:TolB-like protein
VRPLRQIDAGSGANKARCLPNRGKSTPVFITSRKHQKFLRYLVQKTLDGNGYRLKGYSIGVEVFGLPAQFDPNHDSIVRVEAKRLRAKLSKYYQNCGAEDEVHFHLRKGCYQIVFQRPAYLATGRQSSSLHTKLIVSPLLNPDPTQKHLSDSMDDGLVSSLTCLHNVLVIPREISSIYIDTKICHEKIAPTADTSHILEGSLNVINDHAEISIHLFEISTMTYIFSKKYFIGTSDIHTLLCEIVSNVALSLSQSGIYGQAAISSNRRNHGDRRSTSTL